MLPVAMPTPIFSGMRPPAWRSNSVEHLDQLDHLLARAARTALPQASASGSGAPKIDISPSPTIWLTTPPRR